MKKAFLGKNDRNNWVLAKMKKNPYTHKLNAIYVNIQPQIKSAHVKWGYS